MEQPIDCCRQLPTGTSSRSPFTRIIALDWSDGPRAGLLRCEQCAREYRFEPLDEVINDREGRDIRVYSLAPLPRGSIASFEDAFPLGGAPADSPVWAPIWAFGSPDEESALDALMRQILDDAGRPELAIASSDLAEKVLAARDLSAGDLASVTDWFAFLGIARTHAEV